MARKIIMTYGLPASGKSTWAKQMVDDHPGQYCRLNKDTMRELLHNGRFSKINEKVILGIRDWSIQFSIEHGFSVIVDDTNLDPKHETTLKALAKKLGVGFEIKRFGVDPNECVLRDAGRVNPVGAKTIWTMYNKYLRPNAEPLFKPLEYNKKIKKTCIICDIDGTLALHECRGPYEFEKLDTDTLNLPVDFIIATAYENTEVILMSGRSEEYRKPTEKRLRKHKISYSVLYMRPKGDTRPDTEIKKELYENHIKGKYNVFFAIDDRTRIVDQRRAMGIFTLDVNQTREVF